MTGEIFIGIESVGRQAMYGVACNAQGTILGACKQSDGVSFYTTPTDELLPRFQSVLEHLRTIVNGSDSGCPEWTDRSKLNIAIGLTGINSRFDAEHADYVLKEIDSIDNAELCIVGDVETAFVGSTMAVDGTAIFVSAGSVVASFENGAVTRQGGWGPAFTDDGSAYQIGRDALRLIAEWTDRKKIGSAEFRHDEESMTKLWKSMDIWMQYPESFIDFPVNLRATGWADTAAEWRRVRRLFLTLNPKENLPDALVSFAYSVLRKSVPAWWNFVASLSIPIIKEWNITTDAVTKIDPINEIMSRFVTLLDERFGQISGRIGEGRRSMPCVLCGGLLNHHPKLAEVVRQRIQQSHPSLTKFVHLKDGTTCRPVMGSLLLALGRCDGINLRIPKATIVNRIREQMNDQKSAWSDLLKNE
jgi:hypothetical protein